MCLKPIMLYVYHCDGRPDSGKLPRAMMACWSWQSCAAGQLQYQALCCKCRVSAHEQDSQTGLITVNCQLLQERTHICINPQEHIVMGQHTRVNCIACIINNTNELNCQHSIDTCKPVRLLRARETLVTFDQLPQLAGNVPTKKL